jgi:hypothetical protein
MLAGIAVPCGLALRGVHRSSVGFNLPGLAVLTAFFAAFGAVHWNVLR